MTLFEFSEQRTLQELEAVIEPDIATFVRTGLALAEIRARELWRPGYLGWTHYCQERWGFTVQRAGQLMMGAEIALELSENNVLPPTSDRQVRELGRLNPEDRPAAWEEAVGGMKRTGESRRLGPTQAEVREAVDRRIAEGDTRLAEDMEKLKRSERTLEWVTDSEPLGPPIEGPREPAPVIVDLRWTFNRFDRAVASGLHPDDRAELLEELLPMWREMLDRLEREAQ